jgi:hypothetical protein
MGVKREGIEAPVRMRLLPLSLGRIENRKSGLAALEKRI